MSTSKSKVKVTKVIKNAKVVAEPKAAKITKLSPTTKISFLTPRPKGLGGPKTTLLNLVPRKGTITFKALQAKAEAEELNVDRIGKMLTVMAKNGRVELHA
jgi:hypothetical protein